MSMGRGWIILLLWLGLVGGSLSAAAQTASSPPLYKLHLEDSPKALVDEVWQTVNREFVDRAFNKLDWQQVRSELLEREYASRDEAYQAIRVALKKLGDPYTRFLTPREYQALIEQTSGEWIGVGMTLGTVEETGAPMVTRIFPNSPAARAGLKLKDQVTAVDGQSVAGMNLDAVTNRIRGDKDTDVTLTLTRTGNQKMSVTLRRTSIELPVVEAKLKQEEGLKLGYIQLTEFTGKAAPELRQALGDLARQGAQGWILDLRNNPGGRVDAATDVTSLLLQQGLIVSAVDRNGQRESIKATGKAVTDLPLVVLVDRGSASASEIVAAALQENRRAKLVGSTTFGKGVIQQINALSDGSGLNVTIATYQTPTGRGIHKKGIVPDVVVPMGEGQRQKLVATDTLGTEADPQYRRAVTVLGEQLRDSRNIGNR